MQPNKFHERPMAELLIPAQMNLYKTTYLKNNIFKARMEKLLNITFWEGVLIAAVSWVGMVVAPVGPFIIAVFVFVICDKVTGTRAAIKRGETKNSRAMARTLEKLVFYMIALLLSEVVRLVFIPIVPITWAVAALIIRVEFKSNSENIKVVTGVDLWPSVKMFFDGMTHPKK